jgi:hypothetical protein
MLGCTLVLDISIVADTSVEILESSISGVVSERHVLTVGLADSMNDSLDSLTLLVSLYHPDGREIYGGLGTTTPVILENGVIEVSWVPTATGNYTVIVRFEGTDWLLSSEREEIILTRRGTTIEIVSADSIEYPSTGEVSVTLAGGLKKLAGVEVVLCIVDSGLENILGLTSSRGEASFELPMLLAGQYTLSFMFNGTWVFAPVESSTSLTVLPRIIASAEPDTTLYVGLDGVVQVSVHGLGLSEDWNGTVTVLVFDSMDETVYNESWATGPDFNMLVELLPNKQGGFQLNLTITGLPVLDLYTESFVIVVGVPPVHLTLDVATTPVAAALPIVGILGLILRRRFGIELPTEWAGS